jgi:hypothetical protein
MPGTLIDIVVFDGTTHGMRNELHKKRSKAAVNKHNVMINGIGVAESNKEIS